MNDRGSRLEYIDALKGMAILLVVYVHLVNYGLFSLKMTWLSCGWSPAVIGMKFRMPLFFFVSGLLASGYYDRARFRRRVANRLRRQLWPTVVVCVVFNAICWWDGWWSLVYSRHNDCYWFTQSLVQIFLVYAVTARCADRFSWSKGQFTTILACMALLLLAAEIWMKSLGKIPHDHFLTHSYLNRTIPYGQFFLLGTMAAMWAGEFRAIFDRRWPWALCAAYFTAGCIVDFGYVTLPTRAAGVIAVFGVFYYTRGFWSGMHLIARGLESLGRHTLPVYLYHYIFLHLLMETGWLKVLRPLYGGVWEIPVIGLAAVALTGVCIVTDRLLKHTLRPVHTLVYG